MLYNPIIKNVERLYLDTTYVLESRRTFLNAEGCLKEVLLLIENFKDHHVIFGFDGLGKEDILIRLSTHLKVLICVQPDRYSYFSHFHAKNTTNTD